MRLGNLLLWDNRFQAKYGFYFLYAVLTVIYTIALFAVPGSWKKNTAAILIFSDPASMGLFFMGAIVLLEKSQHTPCAFAVSPVRPMEYIIAKVSSLSAISVHDEVHVEEYDGTLNVEENILKLCTIARSRTEIIEFCGFKGRAQFTARYLTKIIE